MSFVPTRLVLTSLVPSRCVGHEVVYPTLSAPALVHSNEGVITNTTDTPTSSPVPFYLNVNKNVFHFVPLPQLRLLFASFPHSSSLYCPSFIGRTKPDTYKTLESTTATVASCPAFCWDWWWGREDYIGLGARVDYLVAPEQVDQ